ncbi:MAG: FadR family transcriptional regulator [Prevotellaceae bacterium]|jgi:GntR family transcriptional repressor for pyruvate dehydrogenase complex|nr:FadR family transcriptional regulator [Prevotellaceae bacterium]
MVNAMILNSFEEVIVELPSDIIIKQIKNLLSTGQLKQGDRLPSERQLAERFGVGRTHVRDAIKKLEFYGIIKTLPQSGSFIAGLEVSVLEGLISDILKLDNYDVYSLVEMRYILEENGARLCALRRTENDLIKMEKAALKFEEKIKSNISAVEEDLAFHRTIAEGSKNMVLKSLLMTIMPDILISYTKYKLCNTNAKVSKAAIEHRQLLEAIRDQDATKAQNIMREHLRGVMEFAKKQKL